MLALVLLNGLIDSFNPCAIGVLLSYLALLLSWRVQRRFFLVFGFFYLLATYATYFLIGLGLLRVFHFFGVHNFFGWVAAAAIFLLGLFNLKEFFLPQWSIPWLSAFFNRCRLPQWRPELTIFSAITLGFLIALCEFPCSGGVYLATVSLLSAQATFWQGILYLLLYNLMFILPLIIIFLSVGNSFIFTRLQKIHRETFSFTKLLMGISMVLTGVLLFIWLIQPIR